MPLLRKLMTCCVALHRGNRSREAIRYRYIGQVSMAAEQAKQREVPGKRFTVSRNGRSRLLRGIAGGLAGGS